MKNDETSHGRGDASHLLGNYGERNMTIVKGRGSKVWDAEGKVYLDCVQGVAVNAFGHCFPPAVEAIREQSQRYLHVSNLFLMEPQMELGAALCAAAALDKAFFCNSGTEATEAAIKFVRRYWIDKGRDAKMDILTFSSSFHGRTYASMAATGQDKIRKGFGPLPAGFRTLPANDPAALEAALDGNVAAILFEPIMAEGGIIEVTEEMARALAKAQAQGVLLIADEIQTGLGRTGEFLACWKLGLKPDMLTLAKPLGGGLPLGAVLMRSEIAASIHAGDHGSTFGGNPVACAAGLAVLKELLRPGFLEDVRRRSEKLRQGLENLVARKAAQGISCGPVTGKGFLVGFHYAGNLPELQTACRANGLLVHRAGQDVLRLLPPLNISDEELDELLEGLDRAMAS